MSDASLAAGHAGAVTGPICLTIHSDLLISGILLAIALVDAVFTRRGTQHRRRDVCSPCGASLGPSVVG